MNRLLRLSAVVVFISSAGLSASTPAAPPEDVAAVVAGNNQFALDLYQQLAGELEENLFVSPYSVSTALAMTYAGARGNTAAQMAETLRFPLPAEEFHPAMGGLIDQQGSTTWQVDWSLSSPHLLIALDAGRILWSGAGTVRICAAAASRHPASTSWWSRTTPGECSAGR